MIYRRLDNNGDYILGQGSTQFLSQNEAIAQALTTWIKLLYGEWWENVNDGTPLWQSILGSLGSENNLISIDNILKSRIIKLQQNGVSLIKSIESFGRSFDPNTRSYKFKVTVLTIYDDSVTITEGINL